MRLIKIPIEYAIDGEVYLTKMKHDWVSGIFEQDTKTCFTRFGYYKKEMSWHPDSLYKIVDDDGKDVT